MNNVIGGKGGYSEHPTGRTTETERAPAELDEVIQRAHAVRDKEGEFFIAWTSNQMARSEQSLRLVKAVEGFYETDGGFRWYHAVPLTVEEICLYSGGLVVPAKGRP